MHTEQCSSINISNGFDILSVHSGINASILEEDLALSSSTHGVGDKTSSEIEPECLDNYKGINQVVYLNEDTMDCNYAETINTPRKLISSNNDQISSPEMFASDDECENTTSRSFRKLLTQPPAPPAPKSPPKFTDEQLITQSDCYLFTRIKKFLTGIPPPPKHTICQSDCSDFLDNIKKNREYFWIDPFTNNDKEVTSDKTEEISDSNSNVNNNLLNTEKSLSPRLPSMRNLINAFDACESKASTSNIIIQSDESTTNPVNECSNTNSTTISNKDVNISPSLTISESTFSANTNTNSNSNTTSNMDNKQVTFDVPRDKYLGIFTTISDDQAKSLPWPVIYKHKAHGVHYNRNRYIEEFENSLGKLCQRYIGNETQSTCTSWFTKQTPGSAKKRSLLSRRAIGQSPGKRLSHLAKRRKTFSSANLQEMAEKKQLIVNVKKPVIKKGKSPRRKSPRNSAKKRLMRRLSLEGPSPRKSKIETSKRALFQSPTSDRAGPSQVGSANPQRIKRALFPTPPKKEPEEQSRKRKLEGDSEGPKSKWSRCLTFDCTRSLDNSKESWKDRYSTGSVLLKSESQQVKSDATGLSDIHRRKLWWAVYEALRSKGVTMNHPKFKEYASQLAKTVRKFMPDLENRNLPRKPGSTSDRMLKLAKNHVLLFVDTKVDS